MSDNKERSLGDLPAHNHKPYSPEEAAADVEKLSYHTPYSPKDLDRRNFVKAEIIYHDPRYEAEWGKLDYATSGSAALDLRACIEEPLVLEPGECKLISSGVAIHLNNPNFMLNIHPRSGLGFKHGIVLGNLTGVVDSDYQNVIGIPAWNRSSVPFTINPGERIAQLITVPIFHLALQEVEEFTAASERGLGGFGSSGVK